MDLTFKLSSELGNDVYSQISRVFVDGFYQWLKYFSKDKEILTRAFAHMFNLDIFYVAMNGDAVAGITACAAKGEHCVQIQKKEFVRHLGFLHGRFAYAMLHKEFEVKTYPIPISDVTGAIEFVAVSEDCRGQGVAGKLIEHIITHTHFTEYVLEVADTNTTAVKLYERLGFIAFHRVPQKNTKQSGINELVYMKRGCSER